MNTQNTKPVVLVVEDDFIIALHIREILKEEGYESIINISSVEDAIVAIETLNLFLVIIDINLKKDKDGVDLGRFLLERELIPFIYISSSSDKITLDRVRETRPHAYIVKPFKTEDIKTTVAIVTSNYKYRNIDVYRKNEEVLSDVPHRIKEVIKFIDSSIAEKINVSELALLTPWKSQHFNKLFQKHMNMSPSEYIIQKKIEKSIIMLIETDLTTLDISFEIGFKSYNNFYSTFKKKLGKSPENYRKWYLANNY